MSQAIQRSMAHGAAWMVLFKLLERSLGAISTLILVRLLTPGDFGMVAMAMSFIAMSELFAAFGFEVALIQNQDAPEEHYHTAWTLNAAMRLGIMALMVALAGPVAHFYRQPQLYWVVLALSLVSPIGALENIGVVAFQKELNFRREFAFRLNRKLVGFAVVVPLAFWLHSYWALVWGTLAGRLAATVMSYRMHPFRPRFSLAGTHTLFRFSKWMLLSNFLGFVRTRASDFVIGRMLGPATLGLYNVGAEFANLPTTELGAPINRALLPGFAQIGNHRAGLSSAYVNAVGFVAMIVVPAAAGIFSVASFLVPVVLGERWFGTAPVLRLLALNGAMSVIEGAIYTLLIAVGFPRDLTRINVVSAAALVALMVSLVGPFGVVGAAYACLGSSLSVAPFYFYHLHKHTGIGITDFFRATARSFAASGVMVFVLWVILPGHASAIPVRLATIWLAAGVGIGAVTYVLVLMLLWVASGRPDGAERMAMERARDAWKSCFRPWEKRDAE